MARPPSPPGGLGDMADSRREFRHPLLALGLAVVTVGALDSFAFLRYGVFVANQSGNALFLGIGPVGEHSAWPASAASLIAFATGAGTVNWLRGAVRRWPPALVDILAIELAMSCWATLNLLLGYGRHQPAARVLLAAVGAFAMGGLTVLFGRTAGLVTPITYQSSTATETGERAVRWLLGGRAARARARTATLLGLLGICGYAVGGSIGALAQRQPHWVPLWGTLALATLLPIHRPR